MSTTTTIARRRNTVALIAGTLNLLISLAVLAGYAAQIPELVTLVPGSAPMRLTTALAVFCSAVAVLLLAGGYYKTAAAAAVACGLAGIVNLAEVMQGSHFPGLDLPVFAAATLPRGGTLVSCLSILGAAALLLMSGVVRLRSRLAIVGVAGSILLSIGIVAVISYFAGVSAAFTTGAYSRMAIPTAVAVAALGAALIRFAWRDSLATDIGSPAWLPLLVGTGTLITSFCLYEAMIVDQRSDFAQQVGFECDGLRQFLGTELDNRIQPLIRLARRRAAAPDPNKRDEWDADVQMILMRGGYQAIEWVDASARVVWTAPPGAGDATPDGNAAFESRRRAAFESAKWNRALIASRTIDLVTGGKGTIVVVPVFVRDELAGYVAGVFRYQLLFQNLLAANPALHYALSVRDGKDEIYSRGAPSRAAGLTRTTELAIGSTRWKLEAGPTEALVIQAESPAGGALLVAGGLLALLFALLTRLAQMARVHTEFENTAAASPAAAAAPADSERLPVVSYSREGAALVWNDAARLLFTSAPPAIPALAGGFRTLQAALLRASGSPGSLEALRPLLESCALPALLFDAEGNFVAANPAAVHTLGWSDAAWHGRKMGTPAGNDPLQIQNVLIMQGQSAVPAAAAAKA